MAILHGFASNAMIDADEYAIRLDEYCKRMAMTYSYANSGQTVRSFCNKR